MVIQRIKIIFRLNAKNEKVCCLLVAVGKLIPFSFAKSKHRLKHFTRHPASFWLDTLGKVPFMTVPTVKYWKQYAHRQHAAVRFMTATYVGESEE